MASVLVVHMDLMSKGGGEAVTMNVLEALQSTYDVTLLTLTHPAFDELNGYYNTDVRPEAITVRRPGRAATALHERFGVRYYVLQNALLARSARGMAADFDQCISTINELGLPGDAIEYVHFPFDWVLGLDNRSDIFHPSLEGDSVYERFCTWLADVSVEQLETSRVFVNSEWTADAFEDAYDVSAEVLYPPVSTREFAGRPWDDRQDGFVAVGRIERSKRIDDLVAIVDGVRERGHDVHLHVVGPPYDDTYVAEIRDLASTRPYVKLEGELPREDLVDVLGDHRYGLHGKRYEHFGMAVAEMAAAGAIPFVPDSGGQHSIVEGDPRLLYSSIPDAVECIDRVLSDRTLQERLRPDPATITRRFGREQFKTKIREVVAESVDRDAPPARTPPAVSAVGDGTPVD